MEIKKIVITGGPCAGKTSALEWIRRDIAALGYRVLVVPETATELISNGVAPWTCGTNFEYQSCHVQLQLDKERAFQRAAETMGGQCDQILIVCDRGELDNKVYMTAAEFAAILNNMGLAEAELLDSYDAVFHLVTAAIGTDAFDTTANNSSRYEDAARSREMDQEFRDAWAGHPRRVIVPSFAEIDDKMKCLINAIAAFLGEAEPYPEAAGAEEIVGVG